MFCILSEVLHEVVFKRQTPEKDPQHEEEIRWHVSKMQHFERHLLTGRSATTIRRQITRNMNAKSCKHMKLCKLTLHRLQRPGTNVATSIKLIAYMIQQTRGLILILNANMASYFYGEKFN